MTRSGQKFSSKPEDLYLPLQFTSFDYNNFLQQRATTTCHNDLLLLPIYLRSTTEEEEKEEEEGTTTTSHSDLPLLPKYSDLLQKRATATCCNDWVKL